MALAAVFAFVKEVNVAIEEGRIGQGDKPRIVDVLADVDRVLGVLDATAWETGAGDDDSADIERLIQERKDARDRRDFAASDRIRGELTERGILLEDTTQGTRWKRK